MDALLYLHASVVFAHAAFSAISMTCWLSRSTLETAATETKIQRMRMMVLVIFFTGGVYTKRQGVLQPSIARQS